ncbi:hypothetical protein Bca52824_023546 [Brassica carinata]|uniref:Uncharacterized protein n=1 Tax=Brassica carinata TaxID=52824 RepID=A0A8X7VIQ3_BRACI|nr:hypothetical protein Bca52824_023546 [Brassica carinata]
MRGRDAPCGNGWMDERSAWPRMRGMDTPRGKQAPRTSGTRGRICTGRKTRTGSDRPYECWTHAGGAEQEEFERLIGKIFEKASEARSKSEIKNCARPLVSFGPILYQELLGRETDRSFHNLVVILVRARVTNRRLRCSLDARVQENVKRVNANLRMDFHNNGSNEWLGFRLESGREFGSLYLGSVRVVITKQHYQTRLAAFDHTKFDKDFGFKVILLTGRREKHMVITIENLINAGFNNWDELILR